MIYSNYPAGAEHDSRAPYNTPDMDAWKEETETKIQDEAQFFISDNLIDLLIENQSIDFIIEQAVKEGLSLCDQNTQEEFEDWANNELTDFLRARIELKLLTIRF